MSSNPAKGPLIDAEPARQHVRHLMAAGVSVMRLAAHTGISNSVISGLLYDLPSRPRTSQMRTQNVRTLLAVKPQDVVAGRIDATGTRRRIQALMAAGWPQIHIGPRINRHPYYVSTLTKQTRVYAYTAHDVAVAYEQIWNANPLHHGVPLNASNLVRAIAKRNGWAPPAAWDDDAIDDPSREPETGEGVEMNRNELAEYRRQEIAHLASFGVPEHEIAQRLGLAATYVHDLIRDRLSPAA
ncbi:hypothetical protein ACFQ6Q_04345 [Streptomyces sp. NPDC056437]|uniref:hypothetical protein n=1 Tax=Streptomyces sp. NPDC056437 TaxID=3345816 RepID=UPI0036863DF9